VTAPGKTSRTPGTRSSSPDRPATPRAVGREWAALLRTIPGYDPFAGAASAGCWFDAARAQTAIDFFEQMLVHIEGDRANQPFLLPAWQKAIIGNLFGWLTEDAAVRVVRRYKEVLLYVPRKNGKTPFVAGLGLFVFFCDGEPGAQCYIAAKDKDQAGLLFRQMQGMVDANPLLSARCTAYGGSAPGGRSKSFVKADNSFLKVISADAGGKHGGLPHLVIVDELHEQDDRELIDTLLTSMTSTNRKQPLTIYLTTADYDRVSICNEVYDNAKAARDDPAHDPRLLPVIYEAAPADPWDDRRTWAACNPNLGVSVSEDELVRLAKKAAKNPAFRAEFRRLHTNVRVRKEVTNAIDLALWDACPPLPADFAPAGRACYLGLDLGFRDDLAALALLYPRPGGAVDLRFRIWIPEGTRRDLRASPFREFIAAGLIEVTPGNSTDFDTIRAALEDVRSGCDLRKLVLDPSYCRSEATRLVEDGFPVEEFRQSKANYTPPWTWLMSDGLAGRKLCHDGNGCGRWMAGNVAIEVSGTNGVIPLKKKSADKIDGITAMLQGVGGWLADPDKDKPAASKFFSSTIVRL